MTATKTGPTTGWDRLFDQPRHLLRYPDEHVVRFLSTLNPADGAALDAGSGSGRHTSLLVELGWVTQAVDSSAKAVRLTRTACPRAGVELADLTEIPHDAGAFNVVVAYASVFYGTRDDTVAKLDEIRRVLAPGGRAFVTLRTTNDSRFKHLDAHGLMRRPAAERGMPCYFASAFASLAFTAKFSRTHRSLVEDTTYTDAAPSWCDSSWLLTLTR